MPSNVAASTASASESALLNVIVSQMMLFGYVSKSIICDTITFLLLLPLMRMSATHRAALLFHRGHLLLRVVGAACCVCSNK